MAEQALSYKQLLTKVNTNLAPSLAEDWPELPAVRAEGVYLYTEDGREYLDFTSGIGVTNLGHNHPKVLNAAIEQMKKFSHSAVGITLHEPLLRLTEELPKFMPDGMDMFFFGNSGSEAIDGALKLARFVSRRAGIIAFTGSFHGRTYGAVSVTSVKSKYRKHYDPMLPGVYFAEFANPYRCPIGDKPEDATAWAVASINKLFAHSIDPSDVAAILVEPVQGEGGYIFPPAEFLKELRRICDENGIFLIFDEVQSGFGRTGQMFAAQTYGVRPDIMAVAKGIANGFPCSAIASSRDIMSRWLPGAHGTTFGGNPVACAAALAVLEVFKEENVLENCRKMGTLFLDGLKKIQTSYPFIGDVRGKGLMIAIEIVKPDGSKTPDGEKALAILQKALDLGLVGYMAGNLGQVLRFIPPLVVTETQIKKSLEILNEAMAKVV
jgi:4-aminobutyrate aminotransferase